MKVAASAVKFGDRRARRILAIRPRLCVDGVYRLLCWLVVEEMYRGGKWQPIGAHLPVEAL